MDTRLIKRTAIQIMAVEHFNCSDAVKEAERQLGIRHVRSA